MTRTRARFVAVVGCLFLAIAAPSAALAAPADAVTVSQSVSASTVEPGDTLSVSVAVDGTDVNGPAIDVAVPSGWGFTATDGGSGEFKSSTKQWVWRSSGSYAVTYSLTVPGDADTSVFYFIDAAGSGIYPETGERATDETTAIVELVANDPPTADSGDDQTVQSGESVELNATGSADPDGDALTYSWTETTSSGVTLTDADTATPTFTAPDVDSETTLSFEVTVTDDSGASDTDTVNVSVEPLPDPANFDVSNLNAPASATQGDEIDVAADVTNTGDESATQTIEFRIDTDGDDQLSDESAVVTEDVTLDGGESTTVEFTGIDTSGLVPGDYAHGVLSEDDTETTTLTIEQANRPPTADAGDDRTVAEVTAVELNATGSADPDGDPLTYRWTEATNTGVTLTDADTATPTFTSPAVDSATTLTFEVTVTDESGATDTDTVNVTVQPTTVTEAVASYGSGDDATIEDDEIQQAVFWWQTGAEVPGTGGETITDGEIQQLVFQWQTGATVTGS
ncbi:PKD domain-containing protein [Haloarcula marina]|uniref:PKD domain-containing protein n=1 Tax=Haloarcula marina TaxID=2961574 RepID=UPI0020B7C3A1|nr:PKD domain-containing protein [Halomicroarcula marina]